MAILLGLESWALGQFQKPDPQGTSLGESRVHRWRAGVIVTCADRPCERIVASVPIPVDWPEQQVTLSAEEVSPGVRVHYRMVPGSIKQMIVTIPLLSPGQQAKALVTLEVRHSAQLPPENTAVYQIRDKGKLDRAVLPYLGPSPLIESAHPKIKALAAEIGTDKPTAWEHVEAIYDWVRENVQYTKDAPKGVLATLKDKTGDCGEMTSLFIAICRAAGIPARTVWVPDHCYPEFYLVDPKGQGHWFPCQAAGSRAFGGIPEYRPILQKGDNFPNPKNPRDRLRYMVESLRVGATDGGGPQVTFVRDLLPAESSAATAPKP